MSQWADGVNAELLRRENRNTELERTLASLVSAVANIETGRSVHNSRHPDRLIDGPVWVEMINALHEARAVLQEKPVTD